jgi:hypothetical protein
MRVQLANILWLINIIRLEYMLFKNLDSKGNDEMLQERKFSKEPVRSSLHVSFIYPNLAWLTISCGCD